MELDRGTQLAFDRTRLSYDRTMMSWVRTATSLITFGFTLYKFFQLEMPGQSQSISFIKPRGFALIMISIGLGSLVLATIDHRRDRTALRKLNPDVPRSMAAVQACLIAILGILGLTAVIFRQ